MRGSCECSIQSRVTERSFDLVGYDHRPFHLLAKDDSDRTSMRIHCLLDTLRPIRLFL